MISGDTGQHMQVIIYNYRVDGLAGYIYHMGAGHPQQHKHAKHPFLIMIDAADLGKYLLIHRNGWNDDNRTGSQFIEKPMFKLLNQPLLQFFKL